MGGVLGKVGKNFAAGMSGGVAYVLDEDRDLYRRLNKAMVTLTELTRQVRRAGTQGNDPGACGLHQFGKG